MRSALKNTFLHQLEASMLINVLVGLGIIMVMATLSIPYIRAYQANFKLSATAQDIVSDLRYAQQLTITEQTPHGVYFDDLLDIYYIYELGTPTSTISSIPLSSGISFDSINGFSANLVRFNSYGSVDQDGSITIINSNSSTSTILVKPSGYIQIQ